MASTFSTKPVCLCATGDDILNKECTRTKKRLYIMTLGCLPMYRRHGIGSKMLQDILDTITSSTSKEDDIVSVFLHVQVNNEEALEFYKKFGFEVAQRVENYYRRCDPPHAFVLEKHLTIQNS